MNLTVPAFADTPLWRSMSAVSGVAAILVTRRRALASSARPQRACAAAPRNWKTEFR
ncbi:MAG: hypothetical protein ABI218_01260 [Caldimonas sp.]